MKNLLFTLNAILPILLPVLLGYFLKKIHFFKSEMLNEDNKLVFKVLIPFLLFSNLYLADLRVINWPFIGYIVIAIICLFLIGLTIVLFISDPKQKGVILQATFRSNYAIIGIPIAGMLGGAEAQASAAIVAAVSVPLFNILAVISLSIFNGEEGQKPNFKSIILKIITNPLIIAVVLGLIVCGINMGISASGTNMQDFLNKYLKFIPDTIKNIANMATPLALLILGAKFEFNAIKKLWKQLVLAVSFRLVITPLIFLTIAYFLNFRSATDFAILIALFATPVAVSSVPMAAQMGQDEELAGQIVVWTSTISVFSLFIIILVCANIGIFAV